MNTSQNLIVFGDRTADEIVDVVESHFAGRFSKVEKYFCDKKTFGADSLPGLTEPTGRVSYILGVVDIQLRVNIERACRTAGWEPVSIVHPSAMISKSAKIGPGCFVASGCAVSVNAELGSHCLVHFNSTIGHDAVLGAHCTVLPGARISGQVRLGAGVMVGSNAVVFQHLQVGELSQIDALTYVRENVGERQILSCRANGPVKRLDLPQGFTI